MSQGQGLFRNTPPAIFPPIMGLFGVGLGWRRAVDTFAAPSLIGEMILGAVSLLYLFALLAYVAKILRRPAVVAEDLKTLPGRAGLAAMSLSGMLLASALVTLNTPLAQISLGLSIAFHIVVIALVGRAIANGPAPARVVTPVWHLVFVGLIVSCLAALPLGWNLWAAIVFWVTLIAAMGIWAVSLSQLVRNETAPPLRPTVAIHLAPASLLGTVAFLSGEAQLGMAFALLALVIATMLLVRMRWLTATGFSPLWGAFTFPLAAFSNLMMLAGSEGGGDVMRWLGGLVLVATTLLTVWIAVKVLQLWAKGVLAGKTNAAVA